MPWAEAPCGTSNELKQHQTRAAHSPDREQQPVACLRTDGRPHKPKEVQAVAHLPDEAGAGCLPQPNDPRLKKLIQAHRQVIQVKGLMPQLRLMRLDL